MRDSTHLCVHFNGVWFYLCQKKDNKRSKMVSECWKKQKNEVVFSRIQNNRLYTCELTISCQFLYCGWFHSFDTYSSLSSSYVFTSAMLSFFVCINSLSHLTNFKIKLVWFKTANKQWKQTNTLPPQPPNQLTKQLTRITKQTNKQTHHHHQTTKQSKPPPQKKKNKTSQQENILFLNSQFC